jgi:hypothetical protein
MTHSASSCRGEEYFGIRQATWQDPSLKKAADRVAGHLTGSLAPD